MRKRKNRTVTTGVPDAGGLVTAEEPGPAAVVPVLGEPLGKLWVWTPDDPQPEVPLAERVAEVIRDVVPVSPTGGAPVGKLWTWSPSTDVVVELPPVPAPPPPPPPPAPVVPVAAAPAPGPNVTLAPLFAASAPEAEVTVLRPVFTLDPDLVLPAPLPLAAPVLVPQLDEPWLRVPPVRTGVPRGVRVGLGALVLATCAALPWAVPQIPGLFAGAVPEQASAPSTPEPTFAPPTPVPSGGVEVNESLAGKRLASAGAPLEVTVQRLEVNAPVLPISGQSGELFPPDDPQVLGWWQEGAVVGAATGTAIVTGHTVSGGGGAFDHLKELVAGDQLSVRTAAGTIEYIVRESQDLPVAELARKAAAIFDQTGHGRLVLITCSDFDGRVYRSNSVVYASVLKDLPRKK